MADERSQAGNMVEIISNFVNASNPTKYGVCKDLSHVLNELRALDYYSVVTAISTWRPIGVGGSTDGLRRTV
jgi:hypothetical protein